MLKQVIFPILLCLCSLCACDDSDSNSAPAEPSPFPTEVGRRTVLIYCAAQNDLGATNRYGSSNWTKDSLELVAGKHFIDEKDRLLVFVDDAFYPRLYRFQANIHPQLVYQWGYEANSSNPATLYDVLTRVKEQFTAQEYGLTMWSHADGWIPSSNTNYATSPLSFGVDVGEGGNLSNNSSADGKLGAQMNISDMANAIKQSGLHFKYIFFDACLMQCVESGYDLREVTDYVVASPISIASNGAYYTHILERGLFSENPCDIAQTYYEDVSSEELQKEYDDFGIVISALKTSELDPLAKILREALQDVDFEAYPKLSGAHAYHVYSSYYYYRPHYFDMRSALRHLLPEQRFEEVDKALSRAIPFFAATQRYWVGPSYIYPAQYHHLDATECCGVSMFIPQQIYTQNASRSSYGDHNESYRLTSWAQAIGKGREE